jgi:hypothetical protein
MASTSELASSLAKALAATVQNSRLSPDTEAIDSTAIFRCINQVQKSG